MGGGWGGGESQHAIHCVPVAVDDGHAEASNAAADEGWTTEHSHVGCAAVEALHQCQKVLGTFYHSHLTTTTTATTTTTTADNKIDAHQALCTISVGMVAVAIGGGIIYATRRVVEYKLRNTQRAIHAVVKFRECSRPPHL